jgi:N-acetylmuramoyl-L-alanine amidase
MKSKRMTKSIRTALILLLCLAAVLQQTPVFANKYAEYESVALVDTSNGTVGYYEPINLMIGGEDIFSDAPGIIVNGRALVPISAILTELGIEYTWTQATREISFSYGGKSVVMQIDNTYATVDGVKTLLPDGVAPRVMNYLSVSGDEIARTYVPVKFISGVLNLSATWIDSTRTVAVNKKEQTLTGAYLDYTKTYPEIRLKVTGEVDATSFVISGADVGGQDKVVVDLQNTKVDISGADAYWTESGGVWTYDIYDGIFGLDKVDIEQTGTMPYTTRVTLYQDERRGHDISYDAKTGEMVIRLINTVNDVSVEKIYSTDAVVIETSENPMVQTTLDGDKFYIDVIGSYLHIGDGMKTYMTVNEGKIESVTYEQKKDSYYAPFDDITRITINLTEAVTYDDLYLESDGTAIYVFVTPNPINNFEYVKLDQSTAKMSVRLFEAASYTPTYDAGSRTLSVTLPKSVTDLGDFVYDVDDNVIESFTVEETDSVYKLSAKLAENTVYTETGTATSVAFKFTNTKIRDSEYSDRLIVIDAGHGGKDPGAIGTKAEEKDLTLKAALYLEDVLVKQGFKVYMTRSTDDYVNLYDRASIANDLGADLFVSVHINAHTGATASGIEVLYANESMSSDKGLATLMQDALIDELGAVDRGISSRPRLVVLRETTMPSVLAELGFISNPDEQAKLMTDSYLQRAAEAMAESIMNFLDK